jgi:hypothetical protein
MNLLAEPLQAASPISFLVPTSLASEPGGVSLCWQFSRSPTRGSSGSFPGPAGNQDEELIDHGRRAFSLIKPLILFFVHPSFASIFAVSWAMTRRRVERQDTSPPKKM